MTDRAISETGRLGDFLLHEADYNLSRDSATLKSGEDLLAGAILGKITKGAVTETHAGNTGNGVCGAITRGALTEVGVYTLRCIAAAIGAITTPSTGTADGGNVGATTMTGVSAGASVKAGTYTMTCVDVTTPGSEVFQVVAPDGSLLPPATVGVAYADAQINFTINDPGANANAGDKFTVLASAAAGNSATFAVFTPSGARLADLTVAVAYSGAHLNMTIADGSADFIVGDTFLVTVAAGSGKYVAHDPAATDGSQDAAAVLINDEDATGGDLAVAVLARLCVLKSGGLTWKNGISADDKAAGVAKLLSAANIKILTSAG